MSTIATNQYAMLKSQQNVHTGTPTNFTLAEKGSHLSQAELRVNREIKIICHVQKLKFTKHQLEQPMIHTQIKQCHRR